MQPLSDPYGFGHYGFITQSTVGPVGEALVPRVSRGTAISGVATNSQAPAYYLHDGFHTRDGDPHAYLALSPRVHHTKRLPSSAP